MTIKRDISNVLSNAYSNANGHINGDQVDIETLDMLIVGAGFAGIWLLQKLRERGFKAKIVEVRADLGIGCHGQLVDSYLVVIGRL